MMIDKCLGYTVLSRLQGQIQGQITKIIYFIQFYRKLKTYCEEYYSLISFCNNFKESILKLKSVEQISWVFGDN